jgi:hypothetical protein
MTVYDFAVVLGGRTVLGAGEPHSTLGSPCLLGDRGTAVGVEVFPSPPSWLALFIYTVRLVVGMIFELGSSFDSNAIRRSRALAGWPTRART